MASEGALLDANILVYAVDSSSEYHAASKALRDRGLHGQETLYVTAHVLYEFIAIVTNPQVVGAPLTAIEAASEAEKLAAVFPLLSPPANIVKTVARLVRDTGIAGRRIYDLVHIATMIENGVTTVYTLDKRFPKVSGITVLTP